MREVSMKKLHIYATQLPLLLILISGSVQKYNGSTKPGPLLNIGEKMPMPDYQMQDTNYNMISPSMAKQQNGVLVLFTANECGVADEWQDRYNMLAQACKANHIGMIAVNPNSALIHGPASVAKNKEQAKKYHYRFTYVSDKHNELADAFGVRQIPIVFLFDKNLKLVYRGSIDDNPQNSGNVKDHYAMDAIASLGSGLTVPKAITSVKGCPVMWEND